MTTAASPASASVSAATTARPPAPSRRRYRRGFRSRRVPPISSLRARQHLEQTAPVETEPPEPTQSTRPRHEYSPRGGRGSRPGLRCGGWNSRRGRRFYLVALAEDDARRWLVV